MLAHHDITPHVETINNFFSSLVLSDLNVDSVTSVAAPVQPLGASPSPEATKAAIEAVTASSADPNAQNGWFGFLTLPIEGLLKLIHGGLDSMGMSSNAWGISIIAMTVVIKALTFPLTKSQLESTNKMQVSCFC
jgi:YidC/Oxa1 family membrane protein insertase